MPEKITGVYVPIITPFRHDETIDEIGLRSHVNFLIRNSISGIIPGGSTGEFIAMSSAERRQIIETVINETRGRVPVYAGTGCYSTSETVELSRHAEAAGASGVMVITPYYLPRNEKELYDHFKVLRDAITIPIMLYHNPHFSACRLSDDFIAKCYTDGLIDALKEGEGELQRLSNLRYMTDDRFSLLYGYDTCPVESLAMVADGWVAGTGNLIPAEAAEIYRLTKDGRLEEARSRWFEIKPFIDMCTKPTTSGLPAPWLAILKEGLEMRGEVGGRPRKPAWPLGADVRQALAQVLHDLGHLPAEDANATHNETCANRSSAPSLNAISY